MAKNDFQYGGWNSYTCNVAGGSGMTCNWIRPNVRYIGILHSGFDYDHITAVRRSRHVILHQSPKLIKIGPPSAEKNDVMSIFQDGGSQPSLVLGI